MAAPSDRVTTSQLEQFVVTDVHLTEVTLGAGTYSSVEEVAIPGARAAAKRLHTTLIDLSSPQQVQNWVTGLVEVCKLMNQLRHPHIVQFLGVCYLPGSSIPALLMEKMQFSLHSLLETTTDLPSYIKVHALTETAQGLVYLHSHTSPVVHCYLTAKNILIDSALNAKLADIGVAELVTNQQGQFSAELYMPADQDVGAKNVATDIFSFGVVSLFTLTQVYPKDLKPSTYRDSVTKRLLGRTEIERRAEYVEAMKLAFGSTHSLVSLTLDCLKYDARDRPSAVKVLGRLEEVGRSFPKNCTASKLDLLQQINELEERAVEQIQTEYRQQVEKQLSEKDLQIQRLQVQIDHLQKGKQQLETDNNRLREQLRNASRQTSLHQQQLETQRRELDRLTAQSQVPSSSEERACHPQLQTQQYPPEEEKAYNPHLDSQQKYAAIVTQQAEREVEPPQPAAHLSSMDFKWQKLKDVPKEMDVYSPPVAGNGKLFARGYSGYNVTVLEYTPDCEQWAELPPLSVNYFTIAIATVEGQLLVVGGKDKFTKRKTNMILRFDRSSGKWVQPYSGMPTALTHPAAVGYQDHLIVAGGWTLQGTTTPDVNILDTSNGRWKTAERLPKTEQDNYNTVLNGDTWCLVGSSTQSVFKAHIPNLISGVNRAWEFGLSTVHCYSTPVAIGNTLLTVGGSLNGKPLTSIHGYDPAYNQWTFMGDLPEPMADCYCAALGEKLFVLGGVGNKTVYVSNTC